MENPLNSSEYSFPILECLHIVSFAMALGLAALVDFRLLGFGLRRQTAAEVSRATVLWLAMSLTMAVFSGLLLFSTDPDKYYLNLSFVFKMICLALAIAFQFTMVRMAANRGSTPAGRIAACVSLALWMSVVFGGIFIAFVEEGLSFS